MEWIIVWCGFLGAWLLVAGPVYQAALELQEESVQRDEFSGAGVERPSRVSPWWWLLPPVAYVLQRRRARRFRHAVMQQMTPAQLEQLVHFTNKATGWLLVASGAGLIAVKETGELGERYAWPAGVFVLLAVAMLVLCTLYTVLRMRRTHELARS